jgi:hypothetical protein
MKKILLVINLALAGTSFAGNPYPNSYEYWQSYRWGSGDLNYHIRQAQLRMEALQREDRNCRLDRFLRDQGY